MSTPIVCDKDLVLINEILLKGNDVQIERRKDGPIIIEKKTVSKHMVSDNSPLGNK